MVTITELMRTAVRDSCQDVDESSTFPHPEHNRKGVYRSSLKETSMTHSKAAPNSPMPQPRPPVTPPRPIVNHPFPKP